MRPPLSHNVGRILRPTADSLNIGGFAVVPNWIFERSDLSEQARVLLAWAVGRPPTWIPVVHDICARLGFGKDKWRRMVGELELLEVIVQSKTRSGGRTTHSLIIDLRPLCPQMAQPTSPQVRENLRRVRGSKGAKSSWTTISAEPKCSGLHDSTAAGEEVAL